MKRFNITVRFETVDQKYPEGEYSVEYEVIAEDRAELDAKAHEVGWFMSFELFGQLYKFRKVEIYEQAYINDDDPVRLQVRPYMTALLKETTVSGRIVGTGLGNITEVDR